MFQGLQSGSAGLYNLFGTGRLTTQGLEKKVLPRYLVLKATKQQPQKQLREFTINLLTAFMEILFCRMKDA